MRQGRRKSHFSVLSMTYWSSPKTVFWEAMWMTPHPRKKGRIYLPTQIFNSPHPPLSHVTLGRTGWRPQHHLPVLSDRLRDRRSENAQWVLFSCTTGKVAWLLQRDLVKATVSVAKMSGQRSQRQVITRGSKLSAMPNRYLIYFLWNWNAK